MKITSYLDLQCSSESFSTARNCIDPDLGTAEKFWYDHEVSFVIVDYEDPSLRRLELGAVFLLA